MAFLTNAELKTSLSKLLQVGEATMESYWDAIISDANTTAQKEIKSRLIKMGYTPANAEGWDRASEFNRDIGLYWCLVKGAVLSPTPLNQQELSRLNRSSQIDDETITVGDVEVEPTAGEGRITRGALLDTNDTIKAITAW